MKRKLQQPLNLLFGFTGTTLAAYSSGWLLVDTDAARVWAGLAAGAWAVRLYFVDWPQGRQTAPVMAQYAEPIKLNGRDWFARSVPWVVGKQDAPEAPQRFVWYVIDYKRHNPVTVSESQLYRYAHEGYARQMRGDVAPFGRAKFMADGWREHTERACKKILTYSSCFDTWGRGAKSKLNTRPARALTICKMTFPPTPYRQRQAIAALEAGAL